MLRPPPLLRCPSVLGCWALASVVGLSNSQPQSETDTCRSSWDVSTFPRDTPFSHDITSTTFGVVFRLTQPSISVTALSILPRDATGPFTLSLWNFVTETLVATVNISQTAADTLSSQPLSPPVELTLEGGPSYALLACTTGTGVQQGFLETTNVYPDTSHFTFVGSMLDAAAPCGSLASRFTEFTIGYVDFCYDAPAVVPTLPPRESFTLVPAPSIDFNFSQSDCTNSFNTTPFVTNATAERMSVGYLFSLRVHSIEINALSVRPAVSRPANITLSIWDFDTRELIASERVLVSTNRTATYLALEEAVRIRQPNRYAITAWSEVPIQWYTQADTSLATAELRGHNLLRCSSRCAEDELPEMTESQSVDGFVDLCYSAVPTPTMAPVPVPTMVPIPVPTTTPVTAAPTRAPTVPAQAMPAPTLSPTPVATESPTTVPAPSPTMVPSPTPTLRPTRAPRPAFTQRPTPVATARPTPAPRPVATPMPTPVATLVPTPLPDECLCSGGIDALVLRYRGHCNVVCRVDSVPYGKVWEGELYSGRTMDIGTRSIPRGAINLGTSLDISCDNDPSPFTSASCTLSETYSARVGSIPINCTESTDNMVYEGAELVNVGDGQIFFEVVSGSSVDNGLICDGPPLTFERSTPDSSQSSFPTLEVSLILVLVFLLAVTISYIAYWVRTRRKLERQSRRGGGSLVAASASAASEQQIAVASVSLSSSLPSTNRASQSRSEANAASASPAAVVASAGVSVGRKPTKFAAGGDDGGGVRSPGPSRESILVAQAALTLFGPPPGPLSTITTSNAASDEEDDSELSESDLDMVVSSSHPAHMSDSSEPTDAVRSDHYRDQRGRAPPRVIGTVYESLARLAQRNNTAAVVPTVSRRHTP